MKKLMFVALIVFVCLAWYSVQTMKRGSQAYLFAYPLLMMEETRLAMQSSYSQDRSNHFTHNQEFPDHTFRKVVRPNVDTLYSVAWLDLTDEPVILSVPDTQDRYYVMPLMDAWTNVYSMIGKRTRGSKEGHYAITSPTWQGELPEGVERVVSPTNMTWLVGRIQTNGVEDISSVAELQQDFLLTPLSRWSEKVANRSFNKSDKEEGGSEPFQLIDNLSTVEYFKRFQQLVRIQTPLEGDAKALENLEAVGVHLGENASAFSPNYLDKHLLNVAIRLTKKKVEEQVSDRASLENGWAVWREGLGSYGTNYAIRAVVAMVGLAALPAEEAVYPNTKNDAQGAALSGEHPYSIHFKAGELPPVNAFWSLTMYDANGFLIDNEIRRYALGDRDELEFNADGSLDVLIQHQPPTENRENWLPAPKAEFLLVMRMYHPKKEFLDGSWRLPLVEKNVE